MSNRITLYVGPRKEMIEPSNIARFDDGKWVAEDKIDGCFGVLETNNLGIVTKITSRTGQQFSDVDGIVGHRLGLTDTKLIGEFEIATQASCKAVEKRGYRRFWVFDLAQLLGQDTRSLELEQRRALLEKSIDTIADDRMARRIVLVRQTGKGFAKFYAEAMERGHEGVVLKRRGSLYRSSTSEGRTDNWIRVKSVRTVDLLVIGKGKTPSRADNLQLGNRNRTYIQSLAVPKGYTADQLIGSVIECLYDVQMASGTFRHLRFVRVRSDKTAEMCE